MASKVPSGDMFWGAILITAIAAVALWQYTVFRLDPAAWASTQGFLTDCTSTYINSGRNSGYKPIVRYTYEVGKARYESRVFVRPEGWLYSKREIDRIMAEFQPGTAITVYYKRSFPSDSALEFRTWINRDVLAGIAVLLTCGAGVAWILVYRTARPSVAKRTVSS